MASVNWLDNNFDYSACIPTKLDLDKITARKQDYTTNGSDAKWMSTPWGIVNSMSGEVGVYRAFRYLITAAHLQWQELVDAIIKHLITTEKFSKEDISKVVNRSLGSLNIFKESINEELNRGYNLIESLTPETKMQMWHDGSRGLNIKACSDAKLKLYYDICTNFGYSSEAAKLQQEAQSRNLSWAMPQYAQNKTVATANIKNNWGITASDFTEDIVNNILTLSVSDLLTNVIKSYKQTFIYLIVALCLKKTPLVDKLKNTLAQAITTAEQKRVILDLIADQDIANKLAELLADESSLTEDIEKHTELNPKLFENNKLKSEVRNKIFDIVDKFISNLADKEISINVKDIILVGSNCSYNYTKDSDLDIHILAETESLNCPDNLYPKLYSAYRSLFNKNININFYGIPVELYVQTEETPMISSGIYSVLNDTWIKIPCKEDIPEIDINAVNKELNIWEDRYNKIIQDLDKVLIKTQTDTTTANAKSIIADQLRGEWDAIKGYEKAIDDLDKLGNFEDAIKVLNSISDEELVHCGELEHIQSMLDKDTTSAIDDGRNEARTTVGSEETAKEKEVVLDESSYIIKEVTLPNNYYLECRANKDNTYEILGGHILSNNLVQNDFHKIYKSKQAAIRDFELYTTQFSGNLSEELTPITEEINSAYLDAIDNYIEDIYNLRKTSLANEGQYSIGNLVFKEIRNKGYLDNLKDLKNKVIGKELSLESFKEDIKKKSNGKWTNKGEAGEHGEFKTKKAADAQRKAMFANGFSEKLKESLSASEMINILENDWHKYYKWNKYTDQQIYWIYQKELAKQEAQKQNNKNIIDQQPKIKHGTCNNCGMQLNDSGECPVCDLGEEDLLWEHLSEQDRKNYNIELSKIANNQVIIQENGLFNIYNIKEIDVNRILDQLRHLPYIKWIQKAAGRFDFTMVGKPSMLQPRIYEIYGQIK